MITICTCVHNLEQLLYDLCGPKSEIVQVILLLITKSLYLSIWQLNEAKLIQLALSSFYLCTYVKGIFL